MHIASTILTEADYPTSSRTHRLGLIVNPIAGMGGRVGLKGSDGHEILERAIALGAVPSSPNRAVVALNRITSLKDKLELYTYPYEMGEAEAKECGFNPHVIGSIKRGRTTSDDTKKAAQDMVQLQVDLIPFAGGDGTARDIFQVIGETIPVLGIPTGVKIHSGVYAINPRSAGDLVVLYLQGKSTGLREAEVMDIDEHAFRKGRVSAKLYGYLRVPYEKTMMQSAKSGSVMEEEFATESIALEVVDSLQEEYFYLIGPGTTTRPILERLGVKKTLLGVDVVYNGQLVASDVNEAQILALIKDQKSKIIISVIGGQGFIFGRGSQQISPEVIRQVGRENIMIVATETKLASLQGRPLLVDTGDDEIDKLLSGYSRVITGPGRQAVYKVNSA